MDPLLDELRALYRETDALSSGWSCPSSTECCRFGVTGREPYVTSLELAGIREGQRGKGAKGQRGGQRDRRGRRLDVVDVERRCPLLSPDGRCTVYEWRPFGCRTFWCERATAGERIRQSDVNDLVRRLKDLSARHQPGGDLGRPLTRALSG